MEDTEYVHGSQYSFTTWSWNYRNYEHVSASMGFEHMTQQMIFYGDKQNMWQMQWNLFIKKSDIR